MSVIVLLTVYRPVPLQRCLKVGNTIYDESLTKIRNFTPPFKSKVNYKVLKWLDSWPIRFSAVIVSIYFLLSMRILAILCVEIICHILLYICTFRISVYYCVVFHLMEWRSESW